MTEKASNYALHATAHSLRSFTARERRRYDESVIGEEQWEIH